MTSRFSRYSRPATVTNKDFGTGDCVQHKSSGEVGVVVERLGRNRLVVSLDNHTTTVWYASSVDVI